ncbi:MAG: hypothetical protein IJS90_07825, partial [Clostridia bacterium]|nr:hypothetical protein [Clostridia bacterium]
EIELNRRMPNGTYGGVRERDKPALLDSMIKNSDHARLVKRYNFILHFGFGQKKKTMRLWLLCRSGCDNIKI